MSPRAKALLWFPAGLGIVLFTVLQAPIEGRLGHDYYLAFAEYLIGFNHFVQNGLSLPHYTASLCGGTPFFADPQSTYFSLPQWTLLVLPPHYAVLFSYAVFYVVGYAGMLKLCRRYFGFEILTAHLTALLFLLNGFCFAHFFVGHVTHLPFLLTPWIVYLVLLPGSTPLAQTKSAAALSLLLAYTFYSGGVHILIVWLALALLLLPATLKELWNRRSYLFWSLTPLFTLALVGAKLAAAVAFLRHGHTMEMNVSQENPLLIFFRYFFFIPSQTPQRIAFGSLAFGPWEYVGFTSKLVLPGALYGLYLTFQKANKQRLVAGGATAGAAVLIGLLATGAWQPAFISVYHNPLKLLAAFLFPLLILFGHTLHHGERRLRRLFPQKTALLAYAFLAVFALWEASTYANFFVHHRSGISFNPSAANAAWAQLQRGTPFPPVTRINDRRGADIEGLLSGQSSLKCAEPNYGYFQEALQTRVTVGPVGQQNNGHFNLHHPGCLLYPDFYGCRPWDRISGAQEESLRRFVHARSSAWPLPAWQTLGFGLHFLMAFFLISFLAIPGAMRIGRLRKSK